MNRTQKYETGTLHANKYSSNSTRKEGQRLSPLEAQGIQSVQCKIEMTLLST